MEQRKISEEQKRINAYEEAIIKYKEFYQKYQILPLEEVWAYAQSMMTFLIHINLYLEPEMLLQDNTVFEANVEELFKEDLEVKSRFRFTTDYLALLYLQSQFNEQPVPEHIEICSDKIISKQMQALKLVNDNPELLTEAMYLFGGIEALVFEKKEMKKK